MNVIINGIKYVPENKIKPLDDKRTQEVLETLTEMRRFNEMHKMKRLAWDAINSISPELAELDSSEAYDLVHGTEDD